MSGNASIRGSDYCASIHFGGLCRPFMVRVRQTLVAVVPRYLTCQPDCPPCFGSYQDGFAAMIDRALLEEVTAYVPKEGKE